MKRSRRWLFAFLAAGILLALVPAVVHAEEGPKSALDRQAPAAPTLPPSKYVNDEGEVVHRVWTTGKLKSWLDHAIHQHESIPSDADPQGHAGRMRRALGLRIELFKELLATRESTGAISVMQQDLARERERIESELAALQKSTAAEIPKTVDREQILAKESLLTKARDSLRDTERRARKHKEQLEALPQKRQAAGERQERASLALKELPKKLEAASSQKEKDHVELLMKNARLEHRLAQENLLWLERQQELLEENKELDAERILRLQLQTARLEHELLLIRKIHGVVLEEERREVLNNVALMREEANQARSPSEKFLTTWQARLANEKASMLELKQTENRWQEILEGWTQRLRDEKKELEELKQVTQTSSKGRSTGLRLKMSYGQIQERRAELTTPPVPDLTERLDEIQSQQIEIQEQLKRLNEGFDEQLEAVVATLPEPGRGAFRATATAAREQVRQALLERRELLQKTSELGDRLAVLTVDRAETTDAIEELILARVFWIRDARPLGKTELALLGGEIERQIDWLGKVLADLLAGRLTGSLSFFMLLLWASLLLLFLPAFLIVLHLRLGRRLRARSENSSGETSCREQSHQERIWTFALSLLSALPLPVYLLSLGGLTAGADLDHGLDRILSRLLISLSILLFCWLVAHNLLKRQCLANSLLRMPAEATTALYRFMRWLLLAYLLLMTPSDIWKNVPFSFEALPRIAYTLFYLLALAALWPLLRKSSPLVKTLTGHKRDGVLWKAWNVISTLIMLLFVAILVMDILGYRFGATHLARSAALSIGSVFLLAAIYRLVIQTLDTFSQAPSSESTDAPGEEEAALDAQRSIRLRRFLRTAFVVFGLGLIATFWDIGAGALNKMTIATFSSANGEPELVSVGDLLTGLIFLLATIWIVRNLKALLDVFVFPRLRLAQGSRYAILTISRWALFVIGVLMTLSIIHLDLGRLGWLVAAMGVGIGFGLQEIIANMVSGVILLVERPIRVGDILSVGENIGEVRRINIRATTILNFDRQEVIVPNKDFITKEVTNWTLADRVLRQVIPIGVAYGSDVDVVREMLLQIANDQPEVLKDPAPRAFFMAHGDSSLDFQLYVYLERPEDRFIIKDRINTLINKGLKVRGIGIPFPQRDLHIRSGELPVRLHQPKGDEP